MLQNLAWINGSVCKLAEAKISLEDRGFLLGDGVYELIRIYNRIPYFMSEHLERLQKSAAAVNIDLPYSTGEIVESSKQLIRKSDLVEGYLYLQLTRGSAQRDHLAPSGIIPTMVMYVRELAPLPPIDEINPVNCITLPDERWLNCHIKSISLLPNILARQAAASAGAVEAIFYRPEGIVTEGTRSNVFAVIENKVFTHPESNLILSGITRRITINILADISIPCFEKPFTTADLGRASEVWLTSTTMEVNPVAAIDGHPVDVNSPGLIWRKVYELFKQRITIDCC